MTDKQAKVPVEACVSDDTCLARMQTAHADLNTTVEMIRGLRRELHLLFGITVISVLLTIADIALRGL